MLLVVAYQSAKCIPVIDFNEKSIVQLNNKDWDFYYGSNYQDVKKHYDSFYTTAEPKKEYNLFTFINDFITKEPRAKNGFTAVELYNWMGRALPMSAISKTLYRMRICGEVVSTVKEDDGRIRIWKISNQN